MALGMVLTSPFMHSGTIVFASPPKAKRMVALPAISATSEVAPFRIPLPQPGPQPSRNKSAKLTTTKEAVHFGAGNIGRGFVAEFLNQSGYEVIFCDVNGPIIEKLQNTPSYTVTEIGSDGVHDTTVSNYRAINSRQNEEAVIQEIVTANLVTCAVGPNNLKFIAPMIAKGIDLRSPLSPPLAVIACENVIGATDKLAEIIMSEHTPRHRRHSIHERARFANSAVDRIVPNADQDMGLNVKIESYCEWVVDKTPFQDHSPPNIGGVKWVNHLQPYIERKLFTVNTGHAATAYYGYRRGHKLIHEALDDPVVRAEVERALQETSNLIVHKHNIDRKEQAEYAQKIMSRISNPHLRDSVERVARSPLRKLSRKERFIGPASELLERGFKIEALLGAVEQALFFQNVDGDFESFEMANILEGLSIRAATEKITGLDRKHPLFIIVEDVVDIVQREGRRVRVL